MQLLITFLAGFSIFIGAGVIKISKNPHIIEQLSIAIAAGSLLSLMIFDFLPEIAEFTTKTNWYLTLIFVLIGVAVLKVLDLFIPDHQDTHSNHDKENAAHIGLISAFAVVLHNIVEGMTVYSLSSDIEQGVIFAIGISLHNIPMGMLICSTLQKNSKRAKTLLILAIVTIATLLGGILMAVIGSAMTKDVQNSLISIALGMIIYIVFAELLPHIVRTKPILPSLIGVVSGFLLVMISCLVF